MKGKTWLRRFRIPMTIVSVLALSVLLEAFFFNRHAMFQERYQASGAIEQGSQETRLDLREEHYIKTVRVELAAEKTVDYRLILLDGQGNEISERTGSISPKLGVSVMNSKTASVS